MARKFLYVVAALTMLVIVAGFVMAIWWKDLTRAVFIPGDPFVTQAPLDTNAYDDPKMWLSRPGMGVNDPARWQPAAQPSRDTALAGEGAPGSPPPKYAVFFIHPTSFLDRARWNAPVADSESQRIANIYVRGMASPFNQASEIWAPKYRQATFGAFLADTPDAQAAIDAAYADVKQAFAFFVSSVDPEIPVVLAGHSQGALHLQRLLRDEVVASELAPRVAAVYVVGWPISVPHDLPALGFPACASPNQSGCIMSWSSYAEPADPSDVLDTYASSIGFDGQARGTSPIVCTNPLTGGAGLAASAERNRGTLIPEADFSTGTLVPGAVPARCDDRGLLLIGDPPEVGDAVLPGNNYHVYDIPLFWANVQADVVSRVSAWTQAAR